MRQIFVKQIPYLDKISKESSMENVKMFLKIENYGKLSERRRPGGAGSGVA